MSMLGEAGAARPHPGRRREEARDGGRGREGCERGAGGDRASCCRRAVMDGPGGRRESPSQRVIKLRRRGPAAPVMETDLGIKALVLSNSIIITSPFSPSHSPLLNPFVFFWWPPRLKEPGTAGVRREDPCERGPFFFPRKPPSSLFPLLIYANLIPRPLALKNLLSLFLYLL